MYIYIHYMDIDCVKGWRGKGEQLIYGDGGGASEIEEMMMQNLEHITMVMGEYFRRAESNDSG
jgi:hypothetical protein